MSLSEQVERLYRDIGNVIAVAQRRTRFDAPHEERDHREMVRTLTDWRSRLADVLALLRAQSETPQVLLEISDRNNEWNKKALAERWGGFVSSPEAGRTAVPETPQSCLLCGQPKERSTYNAVCGCFVCVDCVRRVEPPTEEHPARFIRWDSPDGFVVITRGFYEQELRIARRKAEAQAVPETPELYRESNGLNIDMLDADRLNGWAENIERYGERLTEWADPAFIVKELRRLAKAIEAEVKSGGETPAPDLPIGLIPLNAKQKEEAKVWAADDRLWTTQETVEINLLTFARVILKHGLAASPGVRPTSPEE
jgi:hypothetical protein